MPNSPGDFPSGSSKKMESVQSTHTSTSLSARTLVRLRYDPCAKTVMFRPSRALLPSMAFRTALTALSHFSCSDVLGGLPHDWNVSSQVIKPVALLAIGPPRLDNFQRADESSGVGGGIWTLTDSLSRRMLYG